MKIRKAELDDLDTIEKILKNAIIEMDSNNIHQWDEFYPTRTIFEQDILKKQTYVVTKEDAIVSVAVVNDDFDEQYHNGNWVYENGRFAVVHRLFVNPIYQNQKIGKNSMLMIEDLLRKEEIQTVRLDAFSLNPYALRLYETLGYQKVGEANWRKGLFYLFEKKL